jgi:NADH-quinone oxidoreductase subunit J
LTQSVILAQARICLIPAFAGMTVNTHKGKMLEAILFYFFAFVIVVSAIAVIGFKNPVYSTLSLLVAMFGLAALFLLMQATFLAVIHIVIYAGAIVVLFLFVIMLLGIKEKEKTQIGLPFKIAATLSAVCLGFILGKAFLLLATGHRPPATSLEGSAQALGRLIFGPYLLPFELISILILVAVIGAVYLGKKEAS